MLLSIFFHLTFPGPITDVGPLLLAGTTLTTPVFLTATARVEEVENLQKFGPDYAHYMKSTRMFIPFLL